MDGVWPESTGALEPDCGEAVLDEKGGEVSVVLWACGVLDEVAVLARDVGLVQDGGFWGTGTGVGGERDRWAGVGGGGCFAGAGGS